MQWDIIHGWNDMFEISDETEDELEYTIEEVNRYFQSGHLKRSILDEEEIIDDDSLVSLEVNQFSIKNLYEKNQSMFLDFFLYSDRQSNNRKNKDKNKNNK